MADLIAFVGSARRGGNTDALVGEALRGAREAGGTARRVRLAELQMRPCQGCMRCEAGRCRVHDDDVPALLDEMRAARALLFATPVYFWNVSGTLKTLWDRMLPLAGLDLTQRPVSMTPLIRGLTAGTIVVQEEAEGPHTSIIRLFFERNFRDFGLRPIGDVYAYGALLAGEVREDAGVMDAAFELGQRLIGVNSPSP